MPKKIQKLGNGSQSLKEYKLLKKEKRKEANNNSKRKTEKNINLEKPLNANTTNLMNDLSEISKNSNLHEFVKLDDYLDLEEEVHYKKESENDTLSDDSDQQMIFNNVQEEKQNKNSQQKEKVSPQILKNNKKESLVEKKKKTTNKEKKVKNNKKKLSSKKIKKEQESLKLEVPKNIYSINLDNENVIDPLKQRLEKISIKFEDCIIEDEKDNQKSSSNPKKSYYTIKEDIYILKKLCEKGEKSNKTEIAKELSIILKRTPESIRDRIKKYLIKLSP